MKPAAVPLESYVREGMDTYRQKSEFPFSGSLSLTIYPTLTVFTESRPGNTGDPIVLEEKGEDTGPASLSGTPPAGPRAGHQRMGASCPGPLPVR